MSAQASDAEVQQPIIILSWFWKLLEPVVGLFMAVVRTINIFIKIATDSGWASVLGQALG